MRGIDVARVLAPVAEGRIRGIRVGDAGLWHIDLASVEHHLDDRAEITRRAALWQQSQAAGFPKLRGHGDVRHPD